MPTLVGAALLLCSLAPPTAALLSPAAAHHRMMPADHWSRTTALAATTMAPGSITGVDNIDPLTGEYLHEWLIR